MPRLSRKLVALATLLALFVPAIPAQAHSFCETYPHGGYPNDPHLVDFGCNTPLNFSCGSTNEVYVKASFTGFGILDSHAIVQMWAWNVANGQTTVVTFDDERDWDNKYMKIQTNWHAIRRGSVDGLGFAISSIPKVTLTFGCANNTIGSHYMAVGNA